MRLLLLAIAAISPPALAQGTVVVSQPTHVVHVWAKAFIGTPDSSNSNFTTDIKGTPLLKAPKIDVLGAIIPQQCFSIDNRGFSLSAGAPARVTFNADLIVSVTNMQMVKHTEGVTIPTQGPKVIVTSEFINIGQTRNVNCASGSDIFPPKTADSSGVSITPISKVDQQGFIRSFQVSANVSNPFYSLAGLRIAPGIKFVLLVSLNILTQKLTIGGYRGSFPWLEVYYAVDNGPVNVVTKFQPAKEAGPISLALPLVAASDNTFKTTFSLIR